MFHFRSDFMYISVDHTHAHCVIELNIKGNNGCVCVDACRADLYVNNFMVTEIWLLWYE